MSARNDKKNKMFITKNHVQDIIGRDSPGVGKYKINYDKLYKSILSNAEGERKYSFGT